MSSSRRTKPEIPVLRESKQVFTQPSKDTSGYATASSSSSSSTSHSPGAPTDCSAYDLANAVVEEAMKEAGFTWFECPELPSQPPAYTESLLRLCREFRTRSGKEIIQCLQKLPLAYETLYDVFNSIVRQAIAPSEEEEESETRQSQVPWSRIIAVCACAGGIAVECERRGLRDGVGDLASYLGNFLDNELDAWVLVNGGWESLPVWEEELNRGKERGNLIRLGLGAAVVVGAVMALRNTLTVAA